MNQTPDEINARLMGLLWDSHNRGMNEDQVADRLDNIVETSKVLNPDWQSKIKLVDQEYRFTRAADGLRHVGWGGLTVWMNWIDRPGNPSYVLPSKKY